MATTTGDPFPPRGGCHGAQPARHLHAPVEGDFRPEPRPPGEPGTMTRGLRPLALLAPLALLGLCAPARSAEPDAKGRVLTGRDAFGDWTTDAPGVRRKITVADLSAPFET